MSDEKHSNKITTEMTESAYAYSKKVYAGEMRKQEAVRRLVNDLHMNEGSASDYIVNFRKMMDGKKYTRTLNKEATNYFLTKILEDYGVDKLSNAIQAADKHIEYYEGLKNTTMRDTRSVVSQHKKIIKHLHASIYPDEINETNEIKPIYEGAKKSVTINVYERDAAARDKCIKHYGCCCMVCNFDFVSVYGDIGKNFIHVHHLIPLADIEKEYVVNPIEDLVPVCPNCHAMLHRKNPPYTIDELKLKMRKQSN